MDTVRTTMKMILNPLNWINKTHFNSNESINMKIKQFDNIKNRSLNNVMSLDFAIRELQDDTDYVLPRWCEEFPRISNTYTDFKGKTERPWG